MACLACGNESETAPAPNAGSAVTEADAGKPREIEPPRKHPATAEGLRSQLDALSAAMTAGDATAIKAHSDVLALPSPNLWFRNRFGAKRARKLVARYEPIANNPLQIAELVAKLQADGLTEIKIGKYEKVDDLDAVTYQARALKAMRIADPLFSVRLATEDGKKAFHLWSFVHVDGQFRYIGKLKSIFRPDKLGELDLNEFRPTDADSLRNASEAKR